MKKVFVGCLPPQIKDCADGAAYWDTFADQMLEFSRQQQQKLQMADAEIAALRAAFQSHDAVLRERVMITGIPH